MAGTEHPVTELLARSGRIRRERAELLNSSVYLQAIDELLGYLILSHARYEVDPHLRQISFLIERAQGDVEAAFLTALEGLTVVTMERMRDLMEIEFLLRDFTGVPENLERWLKSTDKERRAYFSPIRLRERQADRHQLKVEELIDSADYQAHSAHLHVGLRITGGVSYGVDAANFQSTIAIALVEILEHSRRLVFAIHDLLRTRARDEGDLGKDPRDGSLPLMEKAWSQSLDMRKALTEALLELVGTTSKHDSREIDAKRSAPDELQ